MPRFDIIKGERVASNADYRDQLPVNLVAVERPVLGARGYLLSHSGLTSFSTGLGADRNGIWNERQFNHYRISGSDFISIDSIGTVASLGTISGNQRASLAYSFNTQAIVADGRMWLYNGTTLTEVTDPDLGDPIDVTWIDGYYFLTDGEFLYHTKITDEFAIDPLQFATAEFSPDPSLAVDKTSDNQVIVFGRYSTEYFVNRATDNFAFQRISGKALKIGVVGTHAETEMDGRFFIVGSSKEESVSAYMLGAGNYQSISSREIDKIFAEYTDTELSTTSLETRIEDRDQFIIVNLPRHTLLYNHSIAQSMGVGVAWTIVKTGTEDAPWQAINGVFDPRIASWVYGDRYTTNIALLDNTVASQYGEQVETIFYSPLITLETMSINTLEIDTIPGLQLNIENVTSAISLTYDGISYGKEWFKLYGQIFDYSTRFVLNRLGYVRDFVGLKVRTVTTERVAFSKMEIDYG